MRLGELFDGKRVEKFKRKLEREKERTKRLNQERNDNHLRKLGRTIPYRKAAE